jgi:hypothetical protein
MKKFAHRSGVSAERRHLTGNSGQMDSAGSRNNPPQSAIRKNRNLTPRRQDANKENNLCAFAPLRENPQKSAIRNPQFPEPLQ